MVNLLVFPILICAVDANKRQQLSITYLQKTALKMGLVLHSSALPNLTTTVVVTTFKASFVAYSITSSTQTACVLQAMQLSMTEGFPT